MAEQSSAAHVTQSPIPLVDLRAQYHSIQSEVLAAVADVFEGMHLTLGPQVRAFEEEFAAYSGAKYGVGVSNGTDALVVALRALGIGPGDEVVTVANSFIATVEAIALVGSTPVFVDVFPDTYTMDWRALEAATTERTRAIIPVHLFGQPADMQPILAFARARGLRVIEDASQAHGASYQGQRVGSFSDIACFSLYCSKNLGAYGEAGICLTDDEALAQAMALIRSHGAHERYYHEIIGSNVRMDEIQAAILRVKLPRLEEWNARRRAHAEVYNEHLRCVVRSTPAVQAGATHVYYVYVVEVEHRDEVQAALQAEGIATGVHYPVPLHLQPACAQYGYQPGDFPVTEAAAQRILSLPMYAELTAGQIERVATAVRQSVAVPVAATSAATHHG
jgi:dTDP-4-amino-4,6-dideoxygalactose transaminase